MERLDPSAVHDAMPALVKELAALGAQRVILYGSRARGDAAERSDIDLAVDAPNIGQAEWFAMEDRAEEAETLLKIDCIWLQKAPENLRENIIRDGKILYE